LRHNQAAILSIMTCIGKLRPEMKPGSMRKQKLGAPSFRFFFAKGWETSTLNPPCSLGATVEKRTNPKDLLL
jgi:hypothetical protein